MNFKIYKAIQMMFLDAGHYPNAEHIDWWCNYKSRQPYIAMYSYNIGSALYALKSVLTKSYGQLRFR